MPLRLWSGDMAAHAYRIGNRLLVVSASGISAQCTQQNMVVEGKGFVHGLKDKVDFSFKITGSRSDGKGQLQLAGKSYDLQDGAVLLVDNMSDKLRVKQLDLNLSSDSFKAFGIPGFVEAKPAIMEFFAPDKVTME